MTFELTILGTSSATPAFGRNQSAQVLNHNSKLFLIDCGEGTQIQIMKYGIRTNKIERIFISHLHGDHFFGLPGLISTMHLNGRTKKLHLYGPPGLDQILVTILKHSYSFLRFELVFHLIDTTNHSKLYENEELEIYSIPLVHGIPCSGFLFKEKQKGRKIISENLPEGIALHQYDELRSGKNITIGGKSYVNDKLTRAPKEARSFAYCSDTKPYDGLEEIIFNVNTLYHEATFLHELVDRAEVTNHTTAKQAGEIAHKANVKKLIIGHFSARYKELSPILAESKEEFNDSYLAVEGVTFEI